MKTLLQTALISILASAMLLAEDKKYETLLDYEDVTVRKIEKDGIRIMHKNGVTKIPIEELPQEVREELGMSMEGIEEHRKQRAAAEAEAAHRAKLMRLNKELLEASYMRIEQATVFQVVDGGVLAHVSVTWDGTHHEVPTYKTVRVGNSLSGYRNQKVKSGTKKFKNTSEYDDWLIYVSCDNSGLVDDSAFSGDVWQAGRYSYTTTTGRGKTISKYTTNPEDITKR
ncbi:hypothetical protein N9133_03215 [Akkermansiaceae bacterium]|nr:hypothetical protein [Akkermansiaceae bacterium]